MCCDMACVEQRTIYRVGPPLSQCVSQEETHLISLGHLCGPKVCTILISVIPAHYRNVPHFQLQITACAI